MPMRKLTTSMRKRLLVLVAILAMLGFMIVVARLLWMQIYRYDFYNSKANMFQTRDTIITPARGAIYDRNGGVLAVSATTEQITLNPQSVITRRNTENGWSEEEQQAEMTRVLSELLGLSQDTVIKQVQRVDRQYQLIASGVEKEIADKLRDLVAYGNETDENGEYYSDRFQYAGINYEPDTRRYYPYGNFASQAIGFLNSDGQGSSGLELQYESVLAGTAGRMVRATNASGETMPYEYEEYVPAVDGSSIVTTLDETVQNAVEKHLETALADNPQARGGVSAIVMDVKTAEVLAIANLPDFDLNEPRVVSNSRLMNELKSNVYSAGIEAGLTSEEIASVSNEYYSRGGSVNLTTAQNSNDILVDVLSEQRMLILQKMWRNKPITDSYEPGSTFKLFTIAAAYEQHVITQQDSFYCSGSMEISGWHRPISCWKTAGHGQQTLTESLMNSCNVAMMTIAARQGGTSFYDYFQAFGLGQRTGIDLPGEATSQFHASEDLERTPSNLATASFGQRFTVTPIQMLNMVCAIVDDGHLKTPRMVKEILNADGTVKETMEIEIVRQVVSKDTSEYLREAMEAVVSGGTGQNAYVAGYRIGGKTATSEILSQSGDVEKRYSASFIGVAPMDDPQVAVIVIVSDLPESAVHGGGAVAAPVVGRIMNDILPYLGVEPIYDETESDRLEVSVPNLTAKSKEQAQSELSAIGLEYRYVGEGDVINDQVPSAGVKLQTENTVILYLGERTKSSDTYTVPNLIGKTPSTCTYELMMNNMFIKRTGVATSKYTYQTRAVKQTPAAGSEVAIGTVITVEFSNSTDIGD